MVERILWYSISAAIVALLTFFSLKFKFSKKTALYIMVGISIASELLKVFTHIDAVYKEGTDKLLGYYITPAALPLHLCSILIFIFFYLALSKNEERKDWIYHFFVPIGIIGGTLGVAFATSGVSFTDPSAYQSFIYHSAVLWFAIYLIATKQVHLGLNVLVRNLITLFALSIVVIWLNGALRINAIVTGNSINFFFLARPPMDNLPFLTLKYGYGVYFVHLLITGIILETLISLPYIISDVKAKKKKQNN